MLATIARIGSYRRIEYLGSPEAVALGQSLLLLGSRAPAGARALLHLGHEERPELPRGLPGRRGTGPGQAGFRAGGQPVPRGPQAVRQRPGRPARPGAGLLSQRPQRHDRGAGRRPDREPQARPVPDPAGRAPDRQRGLRGGGQVPGSRDRRQSLAPAGVGLPGRPGPSGQRPQRSRQPPGQRPEVLAHQSGSGLSDRPQALAELPVHRRAPPSSAGRSRPTRPTCPPESNWPRTCSAWATRDKAGSWPTK